MQPTIMRIWIIGATLYLSQFGCGKPATEQGQQPVKATGSKTLSGSVRPVMDSVIAVWQKGDKAMAVKLFVDSDWSKRPMFGAESVMNLTERQLQSSSPSKVQAIGGESVREMQAWSDLGHAVIQAGRERAKLKDFDQAQTIFNSLKHCGEAIEGLDTLKIVQLTGKAFRKMADSELSAVEKLHQ